MSDMVIQKLYIISGRNSNGKVLFLSLEYNSTVLQCYNNCSYTHIQGFGKIIYTQGIHHIYKA